MDPTDFAAKRRYRTAQGFNPKALRKTETGIAAKEHKDRKEAGIAAKRHKSAKRLCKN
jgi:hypothetical protein